MSDSYIWGGGGDTPLSYDELKRRRSIAVAMASKQKGYPKTIGEGLSSFGDSLYEAALELRDRKDAAAQGKYRQGTLGGLAPTERVQAAPPPTAVGPPTAGAVPAPLPVPPTVTGADPAVPSTSFAPVTPAPVTPAPAPAGATDLPPVTDAGPVGNRDNIALALADQQMMSPDMAYPGGVSEGGGQPAGEIPFSIGPQDSRRWQAREQAIGGIETGGSRNPYQEQGIPTTGGRAQGKFQIMSDNVPAWTEKALGYRMTPEEFRANPNAQHIVFRDEFGRLANRYGDEGAARAWYAGEGGMNNANATDAHRRLSVAGYGRDYSRRLGMPDLSAPAEQQVAQAPQVPVNTLAVRPADRPSQEQLLAEVTGAGQPMPRGLSATAARGDIATDVPAIGVAGTIGASSPSLDASVNQRRNAIASAANGQPVKTAGPVDPTMFDPRPVKTIPIAPYTATPSIKKAPDSLPPSERPIPPQSSADFPDPGQVPPPPKARDMITREKQLRIIANDHRLDPIDREGAKLEYQELEQQRLKADERDWGNWTNLRDKVQGLQKDRDTYLRGKSGRDIDEAAKLLQIQEAQGKLNTLQPLEIAVKQAEQKLKEAEVSRIPDEIEKSKTAVEQARATLLETQQRIAKGKQKPHMTLGNRLLEQQEDGSWKNATPDQEIGDITLTEKQGTALKNFERARQASHKQGDFLALAGLKDSGFGRVPIVGNYLVSPEYQTQKSEARAWGKAVLRDDSGAVLGDKEIEDNIVNYFPVPGDEKNPQLIEIKRQRREVAERSLYDTLGPGRKIADKFVEEQKAQSAASEEAGVLKWIREHPGDPRIPAALKKLGIQ